MRNAVTSPANRMVVRHLLRHTHMMDRFSSYVQFNALYTALHKSLWCASYCLIMSGVCVYLCKTGIQAFVINCVCVFMMTSSNGNISALQALYAGNSPVTRSFDVFFDLRLNKQLSKQSRCWWFQTQSRPLWRHCNGIFHSDICISHNGSIFYSDTTTCDMTKYRNAVC